MPRPAARLTAARLAAPLFGLAVAFGLPALLTGCSSDSGSLEMATDVDQDYDEEPSLMGGASTSEKEEGASAGIEMEM